MHLHRCINTILLISSILYSCFAVEFNRRSGQSGSGSSSQSTTSQLHTSVIRPENTIRTLKMTLQSRLHSLEASHRLLQKFRRDPRNESKKAELIDAMGELNSWPLENALQQAMHADARQLQQKLDKLEDIIALDMRQQKSLKNGLTRLEPWCPLGETCEQLDELDREVRGYGRDIESR